MYFIFLLASRDAISSRNCQRLLPCLPRAPSRSLLLTHSESPHLIDRAIPLLPRSGRQTVHGYDEHIRTCFLIKSFGRIPRHLTFLLQFRPSLSTISRLIANSYKWFSAFSKSLSGEDSENYRLFAPKFHVGYFSTVPR